MYRLSLLGDLHFTGPGGPVTGRAAQRRRIALLACLAVSRGRPVSREKLLARLWPDADADRGRHLLSDSIYLLRRQLGDEAILTTGDDVRLNEAVIASDVFAFEQAIGAGDLETAAALYGGPFLDGFHLAGSAEFDQWLSLERDRLARAYATALETLARACSDPGEAAVLWGRLAAHDPTSTRIATEAMRALDDSGDRAGAIRLARMHAAVLRDVYGLEPDPAVLSLAERLQRSVDRPAGQAESHARAIDPFDAKPSGRADRSTVSGAVGSAAAIRPAHSPARRRGAVQVVALALTVGLGLLSALRLLDRSTTPVPVLVAQENGDTLLGDLVAAELRRSLAASPKFVSVSDERIAGVLRRTGRAPAVRLTPALAREVAIREGFPAFVRIEVQQVGDVWSIRYDLVSPEDGELRDSDHFTARTAGDVVFAIGRVSERVRQRFGESLAQIRRTSRPYPITTDSIRALLLHRDGFLAWRLGGDPARALELTDAALAIDPELAHGYLLRSWLLEAVGAPDAERVAAFRRAFALRDRLLPYERYAIEGRYYAEVEGDLQRAATALRTHVEEARKFERGEVVISFLSLAQVHLSLRDLEEAERVLQDARRWYPGPFNQALLVRVLYGLGRTAEAREVLDEALHRFPGHPWLEECRAHLAAASGDRRVAHAIAMAGTRRPDAPNGPRTAALFDAAEGRYDEAIGHLVELRDGLSPALRHRATEITAAIGRIRLAAGDTAAAVSEVEHFLAVHAPDSATIGDRAMLLLSGFFAEAGAPARARALLATYLSARDPDLAWLHGDLLAETRAAILLADDSADAALRLLLERRGPEPPGDRWFDARLLPRSHRPVLARAYARAGAPDSAIAVWERYVDARVLYRAEIDAFDLGPALRELAALHARRGDTAAAEGYQRRLSSMSAAAAMH